ncbi:hypothetical protein GGD54_005351 [Rhizobium tropici]|uniref:Uncharacterized protein n=4 Tax=Rhizobium TaxID=379 RepID=A0A7W9D3B1_9HYPH|nr:hypothetical protein [Rhizobium tropici]MBB4569926.1 hypothetical protein [Rhizobium leucaenae]MBB5576167.1 hypothetical protein [Rhizobium paranaense]MBB6489430.1 hypothetical protein [Rhizobium lusitanum]MBB5596012.1 hypothetical protein [Rhizobium tropici]
MAVERGKHLLAACDALKHLRREEAICGSLRGRTKRGSVLSTLPSSSVLRDPFPAAGIATSRIQGWL